MADTTYFEAQAREMRDRIENERAAIDANTGVGLKGGTATVITQMAEGRFNFDAAIAELGDRGVQSSLDRLSMHVGEMVRGENAPVANVEALKVAQRLAEAASAGGAARYP